METDAAHALIRFGLGRKGNEPLPSDPRGWALAQLGGDDPGPAGMASTEDGLRALHADREQKLQGDDRKVPPLARENSRLLVMHAVNTAKPFRERLVWFWTNHFTVSIRQGGTNAVAAAFMQEAIRPHVTGRFGDMLLAVMRHPAMLMYLDNTGSIGPNSLAGLRQHSGLNENLARECMELHTLSPAAGYTQGDVTSFAKLVTGWSVDLKSDPPGFRFRPATNEPFDQTVLGIASLPASGAGLKRWPSSRRIPQPIVFWRLSWSVTLWPIIRLPARSRRSPKSCTAAAATSALRRGRWSHCRKPGPIR